MQKLDWLVVATVVAIVLVLLDGFRRKWIERRNRVVVKLDRNILQEDIDLDRLPNSELPNGGARTLPRAGDPAPVPRKRSFNLKDGRDRRGDDDAESAPSLPQVQSVPVLMDPVEIEETDIEHANVFVTVETTVIELEELIVDDGLPPEVLAGLDREFADDKATVASATAEKDSVLNAYDGGGSQHADTDDSERLADDEETLDETGLIDELADRFVATEPDPLMDGYAENSSDDEEFDQQEAEEFADALASEYEVAALAESGDEDDLDAESIDAVDNDDAAEETADQDADGQDEDQQDDEDAEYDPYDDDDNYENEPALLENAYRLAASHFQRPPAPTEPRIEPGFGEAGQSAEFEPAEAMTAGLDESSMAAFLDEEQEEIRAWRNQSVTQQSVVVQTSAPITQAAAPALAPAPAPVPRAQSQAPLESMVKVTIPSLIHPLESVVPSIPPAPRLPLEPEPVAKPVVKPAAPKESRPGFWETAGKAVSNVGKAAAKAAATARANQGELFQHVDEPSPPQIEEPTVESGPQEVIIINVMAKAGQYFYGDELLPVLQHFGMRLGSMNIFHRHTEADGTGPVMFSMANMVKPGTFTLAAMQELVTPGISFFVQMPNRHGNMKAFEQMLAIASAVKQALDGDLKDERRSVLTRQTVEHCRQRIRDFELSLLSRK